jgi:Putative Ig domain/Chitobiase/beta-hexosaminidase C-terminal domain/Bacterial Ig domain/Glucodextranase, domain B/Bacterial Ig-like domain (group 2)
VGAVDEVAVYNTVLSETTIANQYAKRTTQPAVSLQLTASDPDGDPLVFTATGLPSTLVLNPATGLISGNPTAAGTYNVTVTVTDPGGLSASRSFSWTFAPPTMSVAMTNPFPGTTFTGPVDLTLAATASGTNTTATQVEFFAGETSLGIDTTAPYQISWTSVPAGTYSLRAVATNNFGGTNTSPIVGIAVTEGGTGSGTLGQPIPTPAPGVYAPGLQVSLNAADGATIRYTTNGSTPTASSPIYAGPIAATDGIEIRARAFQQNWTTSPALVAVYHIDTTPPSVRTVIAPAPNAAGWNHTDVVVRFDCQDGSGVGVANCPPPVALTAEASGQTVTRVVSDVAGNSVTISVTVNIDKTAPQLALSTQIPEETGTSSLAITGTVSDNLSGTTAVSCNGDAATLQSGSVSCDLSLEPGLNPILIVAKDAAGNTSSASGATQYGTAGGPPATALQLSPARASVAVGKQRVLDVRDNFGRAVSEVTWTSTADNIATVSDGVVVAIAPGVASIIATLGELTASTDVTVLSGATVPYGTNNWETTTTPGYAVSSLVTGLSETMSGDSTYYVVANPQNVVGRPTLEALADDGQILWSARVPVAAGAYASATGHALGGVLLSVYDSGYSIISIKQGASGGWRRDFQDQAGILGQSGDGTVFVSETVHGESDEAWISLLDGMTGSIKARIPLAQSSAQSTSVCPEYIDPYYDVWTGGLGGDFVISAANVAYFFVSSSDRLRGGCPGYWINGVYYGSAYNTWNSRLELWTLSSSGALATTLLATDSGTLISGVGGPTETTFSVGTIVPRDGNAGAIFTWTENQPLPESEELQPKYFISSFPNVSKTENDGGWLSIMGENNTVFMTTSDGVVRAMDASSFATRWAAPGSNIVAATEEGGVAIQDEGTLKILDSEGALLASGPVVPGGKPTGDESWIHTDGTSVVQSAAPIVVWAASDFNVAQGSLLGSFGAIDCTPPKFPTRSNFDLRDYTFWVDDQSPTSLGQFTSDERTAMATAGQRWASSTNSEAQFPGHIVPGTQTSHNTVIRWHNVDQDTFGYSSLPVDPVDFYDFTVDGRKERRLRNQFGMPLTKFGVSVNINLAGTFVQEPAGPFLPGFTPAPGFGLRFFTFLTLHEFGHTIGLGHPHTNCSVQKTVMGRGGNTFTATHRPSWTGHDRFKMWPTALDNEAVRRIYR